MSDQFYIEPYTDEDEPRGHFIGNEPHSLTWIECPRDETCEYCDGMNEDQDLELKPKE